MLQHDKSNAVFPPCRILYLHVNLQQYFHCNYGCRSGQIYPSTVNKTRGMWT